MNGQLPTSEFSLSILYFWLSFDQHEVNKPAFKASTKESLKKFPSWHSSRADRGYPVGANITSFSWTSLHCYTNQYESNNVYPAIMIMMRQILTQSTVFTVKGCKGDERQAPLSYLISVGPRRSFSTHTADNIPQRTSEKCTSLINSGDSDIWQRHKLSEVTCWHVITALLLSTRPPS